MFAIFANSKTLKIIQYQILRYLPDRVSGEFVNLGIVACDPSAADLESEFIKSPERILCRNSEVDASYLVNLVRGIKQHIDDLAFGRQTEPKMGNNPSIETFTLAVLPKDDSSLIFSEVKKALGTSAKTAASDLFSRLTNIQTR